MASRWQSVGTTDLRSSCIPTHHIHAHLRTCCQSGIETSHQIDTHPNQSYTEGILIADVLQFGISPRSLQKNATSLLHLLQRNILISSPGRGVSLDSCELVQSLLAAGFPWPVKTQNHIFVLHSNWIILGGLSTGNATSLPDTSFLVCRVLLFLRAQWGRRGALVAGPGSP